MGQTKGVRLNLPKWCSMEMAEQMGLTSHAASKDDVKVVDKNSPLYCKTCCKLFAKDTVFKAHLTGSKHIKALKALKTPFALAEAQRLESALATKQKFEAKKRDEAAKRKREGGEAEEGKEAGPAKKEGEAAEEDEEGDKKKAKLEVKIASTPEEALLAGQAGSGFQMELGQEDTRQKSPKKKVVAKDWWKGTIHKSDQPSGGEMSLEDEKRRGNWFCESRHCTGVENNKLAMKCSKCGATRRFGTDGYQPNVRNTTNDYARREDGGDNRTAHLHIRVPSGENGGGW